MSESILCTVRTPFGLAGHLHLPAGSSLADMARSVPGLPEDFAGRGAITVNGKPAPRALWHAIRPKPRAVTEVAFFAVPQGGGGEEGGKNPLMAIASVALLAVTGFVAGGALAGRTIAGVTFGQAFAAGGIGANLTAAGIGLLGQALIGSMAPAPGLPAPAQADTARAGAASAKGNVLSPGGAVPRVIGTRKVFPPFACEPLVYYDGEDEVVEALYALSGPHDLDDIRIGSALASEMDGVEIEAREGWPGDAPVTLITRQARSEDLRNELRGFVLQEDGVTLDQEAEGGYLPQALVIATREAPDELRLGLSFPRGLNRNGTDDDRVRVPLRLRLRPSGSETWQNLPELHFVGNALTELRATIRLIWTASPDVQHTVAPMLGWVEARIMTPDQTVAPAGGAWVADSSFDAGSGDDWLVSNNLNDTAVRNVIGGRHEVQVYLDTASFPQGRYEVEMTRGAAVIDTDYDPETYEVRGDVWDLFGFQGEAARKIVRKQTDLGADVYAVRASSIWNEHPVQSDGFALVALRARNRALQPLSVVASGYVRDWDGSAWASWTTTSNPAPHYRDVMFGRLNARPVPVDIIDDDDLVAWRSRCASEGFEANIIIEGSTAGQAMARIASAGFAMPRMSNSWGVVAWRDTSAEDPAFVFSAQNMRGLAFEKTFPDLPDGIRATFRDAARDYEERQILHPADAVGGLIESRDYDEVTEAEVRRKVDFELAAVREQSASYSGTVPAISLAVRRGDLVGVEQDILTHQSASARVMNYTVNGSGELTTITLDREVTIIDEDGILSVADILAEPDVLALGLTPAVVIVPDGAAPETHALSDASGATSVLTLATPAASDIHLDAKIIVGPSTRVVERFLVTDVQRGRDFTAVVTLSDELTTWTP